MDTNVKQVIEDIRRGAIDINNQELFFSTLIKGLILRLDDDISIRGNSVPHMIINTGSDAMYLEAKGQDFSVEPYSVSNENYIYQIVPRCVVNLGGLELVPDQLTNPYAMGQLQYEDDNGIYTLQGEFRRMPIKLSVDLKYFTDSYRDQLELIQQVISKLSFIRMFNITYMGQLIQCSYKIPESFQGEHIMELDGKTQDDKCHTLPLQLEIETSYPVYSARTIMSVEQIVATIGSSNDKYKLALDYRYGTISGASPEVIEIANGPMTDEELIAEHKKRRYKSPNIIVKDRK